MHSAIIALLLAAGGSTAESTSSGVAVVITGRTDVSEAQALEAAQRISTALWSSQVRVILDAAGAEKALRGQGLSDSASCEGRRECSTRLGVLLKVPVVVG